MTNTTKHGVIQLNRQKFDLLAVGTINIVLQMYAVVWLAFNFNLNVLAIFFLLSMTTATMPVLFVHRAWSHKSWIPNRYLNWYGLFMYNIALSGTAIGYVATHREHHKHTDVRGDPHSPYLRSRLSIQLVSTFDKINVNWMKNSIDLLRQPDHMWFARYYWYINIIFYGCLYLITPEYFPMFMALRGLGLIKGHLPNSIMHNPPWWVFPVKFSGHGASNSIILNILFFGNGECWHANHHEDPTNWKIGKRWYEIDIGAQWIRLFVYLGWATIPERKIQQ